MAKMRQGILGGLSGTIGGTVGTAWKGIAVLKSKPISVANPRTAAQINNRNRNTAILYFCQSFGVVFVRQNWNRFAKKMTGFNLMMSKNAKAYDPVQNAYIPDQLMLTAGSLSPMTGISVSASKLVGLATVDFDARSSAPDSLGSDIVHVGVFNTVTQTSVLGTATAVDTTITIPIPDDWSLNDEIVGFVSAIRLDGMAVSNAYGVSGLVQS